jgi:CubicO group peptidase (beta-lactamase class C family)
VTLRNSFHHRRRVLAAATGMAALATAPRLLAAADPAAVAGELGTRLDEGVQRGDLDNLHAVYILRHGKPVFERYYQGADELRGRPLGTVAFSAATPHDLRSVTKSIVGLLYGIALAEGKVPPLASPAVDSFPKYEDLAADARRRRIHISHVLSMTMGLAWNEELPYTDARNSELAMERSIDRYRYVLEQPIVDAPGVAWRYSGGATALLGRVIAAGTGMPLLDYAQARLFAPLGIAAVEWTPGFDGEAAAASGLRMRAPDLARIGQLMLQQGRWGERQVVPADWVAACMTPRVETGFEGLRYGYHWFVATRRDDSLATMAIGLGGQRLVVVPSLELAYVIYMGNYRRADHVAKTLAVQAVIHQSIR